MEFKMGGKFLILIQVLLISLVKCEPCSKEQSINVTSGDLQAGESILHDGVVYKPGQWYEVEENGTVSRFGCPCLDRVCLRKCCDSGDMYLNMSCQESPVESLRVFSPKVYKGKDLLNVTAHLHFFYLHNLNCKKYLVDPLLDPEELFIQENGTLLEVSLENEKSQWIAPSEYCVDMMMDDTDPGSLRMVAVMCYAQSNRTDDSPALYISYAIGLLLSVPFLLATFMVYAFIPDLRNLHGMCLMAYCSGLIVAYIFLAYLKMHFGEDGGDTILGCMVIAFIVYYAFQTSFFWLNVMCFDIWRTFSGYRGSSSTKRRELRRFAVYGLYAWGVPLLLTACTVSMQFAKLPRWVIKPGFGERKCWFSDWMSELVYFFTPVLVLVICNLVLFTVTAYRIRSIRQETAILKGAKSTSKLKQDKQRYSLYLKLFVVMGINWSVELISFVVGGSNWYWILVDISNIMLGFFIFIIFVWKKKVRNLARRRYRSIRGLPPLNSSDFRKSTNVTSSAVTEETRLSSDDAHLRLKDLN